MAIVGTRRATSYGKNFCGDLLSALSGFGVNIVSGLAYGIDSEAHRRSLDLGMKNYGVVAHGLGHIYPSEHAHLASRICDTGLLLSEHFFQEKAEKEFFPMRNRIIAGLADAVLVVESTAKGGALITAELANSYNRDVFALPGRRNDEISKGCNNLIKSNRAHLVDEVDDILHFMNLQGETKVTQTDLFSEMTEEEAEVVGKLKGLSHLSTDELASSLELDIADLSMRLLEMEIKGLLVSLPGNRYCLK